MSIDLGKKSVGRWLIERAVSSLNTLETIKGSSQAGSGAMLALRQVAIDLKQKGLLSAQDFEECLEIIKHLEQR